MVRKQKKVVTLSLFFMFLLNSMIPGVADVITEGDELGAAQAPQLEITEPAGAVVDTSIVIEEGGSADDTTPSITDETNPAPAAQTPADTMEGTVGSVADGAEGEADATETVATEDEILEVDEVMAATDASEDASGERNPDDGDDDASEAPATAPTATFRASMGTLSVTTDIVLSSTNDIEVNSEESLREAISRATSEENTVIVLTGSFAISNTVEVENKNLTLRISKDTTITSNAGTALAISGGAVRIEGAGDTSMVQRGSTEDGALVTATNGANVTLAGVTLDGNKDKITSTGSLLSVTGEGTTATLEEGATIQNNKGDINGAGVSVSDGGTLTMKEGSTVQGNHAAGKNFLTAPNGGGVYVGKDGTMVMEGGSIKDNKTTAIFSGKEQSYGNGGGIAVEGGSATITGGTISGNNAQGGGGVAAIGLENGPLTHLNVGGYAVIENNTSMRGGGIYATGPNSSMINPDVNDVRTHVLISGNALIQKNKTTSTNGGAGIYIQDRALLSATGGTVSENETTEGGYGAGIRIDDNFGYVTELSGMVIVGNVSDRSGGGIYVTSMSAMNEGDAPTLILKDVVLSNNEAVYGGAGLNAENFSVTIDNSRITDNANTKYNGGGGIHMQGMGSDLQLTISSSEISGNVTEGGSGGGIYASGVKDVSITGTAIADNTAGGNGGGIFINESWLGTNLTINDSEITNNSASRGGGGIALFGEIQANLTNTTIKANTSEGGGGGIYADSTKTGTNLTINGGEITENTAEGDGGAIDFTGGTLTISNVSITENYALVTGGGIYVHDKMGTSSVSLTLNEGTELYGNQAGLAGDDLAAVGKEHTHIMLLDKYSWYNDREGARASASDNPEEHTNMDNLNVELYLKAMEEKVTPPPTDPGTTPTPPPPNPDPVEELPGEPTEVELSEDSQRALRNGTFTILDYVVPLGAGDSTNHGECFE